MRFSVFFVAALALLACASAALELRCSSGTLQGVGGELAGVYSTKSGVQRPVSKICRKMEKKNGYLGAAQFRKRMGPLRTREGARKTRKVSSRRLRFTIYLIFLGQNAMIMRQRGASKGTRRNIIIVGIVQRQGKQAHRLSSPLFPSLSLTKKKTKTTDRLRLGLRRLQGLQVLPVLRLRLFQRHLRLPARQKRLRPEPRLRQQGRLPASKRLVVEAGAVQARLRRVDLRDRVQERRGR